jgi:hypothetical protein
MRAALGFLAGLLALGGLISAAVDGQWLLLGLALGVLIFAGFLGYVLDRHVEREGNSS